MSLNGNLMSDLKKTEAKYKRKTNEMIINHQMYGLEHLFPQ